MMEDKRICRYCDHWKGHDPFRWWSECMLVGEARSWDRTCPNHESAAALRNQPTNDREVEV